MKKKRQVCSIYALLYAIIAVESLQHQHIDRRRREKAVKLP